jgi:hypothetical protein
MHKKRKKKKKDTAGLSASPLKTTQKKKTPIAMQEFRPNPLPLCGF